MNKKKGLKTFFISDWHAPYEDKTSLRNVLNFMYEQKPKIVVLGGDLLDFYEVSNFSKSPERMQTLQQELDIVRGYLEEIRKKLPKARIIYLEGNHEYRLIRYLHNNPELYSLRDLRVPKLLRLKELRIEYRKEFMYCNFLFKHGEFSVPQTAYKEYTHEGCSGVSGHCFDEKTEILTDRGWKFRKDLLKEYKVMTFNKKTRNLEWNAINHFYDYSNYNELISIKNRDIDLLITPEHGLIGTLPYKNKLIEFTANEFKNMDKNKHIKFFNGSVFKTTGLDLSDDELRLKINIAADGGIEKTRIRWHLKKERKIKHLRELLNKLDILFNETKQKNGTTKFSINNFIGTDKTIRDWILNANEYQTKIILDEYSITDGNKHRNSERSYQIATAKEYEAEYLQTLFSTRGYRCSKIIREKNKNKCYYLTINTNNMSEIKNSGISTIPYKGKVWCVNVNNGTLLIRRNNKICITQNTHRMQNFLRTDRFSTKGWWVSGHLGDDTKAMFGSSHKDWQHGFIIVNFEEGTNIPHVEQILIDIKTHRFIYGGVIYGD